LGFSPDGKTLGVVASVGEGLNNGHVIGYDTATRKETLRFKLPGYCHHFLYTPDGESVLTFQQQGDWKDRVAQLVQVRDAKTGKLRHTIRVPRCYAHTTHVKPDGKTLVCWGPGHVQLIELATGRGLDRFPTHEDFDPCRTALSADGQLLALLQSDAKLRVYEVGKGKLLWSATAPKGVILACSPPAFRPDGKAVSFVAGGDVLIHDARTGKLLYHKKGAKAGDALALGFAGNQTLVLAGNRMGAGVGLFSFRRDRRVLAAHNEVNRFGEYCGAISLDGRWAAVARSDGQIRLFQIDPNAEPKDD
jgi:WD40 repeat protein